MSKYCANMSVSPQHITNCAFMSNVTGRWSHKGGNTGSISNVSKYVHQ